MMDHYLYSEDLTMNPIQTLCAAGINNAKEVIHFDVSILRKESGESASAHYNHLKKHLKTNGHRKSGRNITANIFTIVSYNHLKAKNGTFESTVNTNANTSATRRNAWNCRYSHMAIISNFFGIFYVDIAKHSFF